MQKPRYAILIDGGFLTRKLHERLGRQATADDIIAECDRLATIAAVIDHELLRVYYYDAYPASEAILQPVSGEQHLLGETERFRQAHRMFDQLVLKPNVALRMTDRRNDIEVELAHAGMILTGADRAALDAGANLALVGEELLQFAAAEPLGGARWRLSGLWRGRRGTEAAIGTQVPGDRFVLIAADALTGADLPSALIGGEAWVLASGVGDSEPAEARARITGASVVPPSPVRLRASERPDGTTILSWTRRSRAGWRWIDGSDAPLVEERERYRVTVTSAEGRERSIDADMPETVLTASDRATALTIEVRQLGTNGASPPATLMLAAL